MKIRIASLLITVMLSVGALNTGCSLLRPEQSTHEHKVFEIELFVKLATRVVLVESNLSQEDIENLQSYLSIAKDLLNTEGPDLEKLRNFITHNVPDEYKVISLTVVDVIERYVVTNLPDLDENVVKRNQLILAGINGALLALEELNNEKPPVVSN